MLEPRSGEAESGRTGPASADEGLLRSVAYRVSRIVSRLRHTPEVELVETVEVDPWSAYEAQVEEAKKHPTVSVLDQFFLCPDQLSAAVREETAKHVTQCGRCQEVAEDYRVHRDAYLNRQDKPCD